MNHTHHHHLMKKSFLELGKVHDHVEEDELKLSPLQLPQILTTILSYLDPTDLLNARAVNSFWNYCFSCTSLNSKIVLLVEIHEKIFQQLSIPFKRIKFYKTSFLARRKKNLCFYPLSSTTTIRTLKNLRLREISLVKCLLSDSDIYTICKKCPQITILKLIKSKIKISKNSAKYLHFDLKHLEEFVFIFNDHFSNSFAGTGEILSKMRNTYLRKLQLRGPRFYSSNNSAGYKEKAIIQAVLDYLEVNGRRMEELHFEHFGNFQASYLINLGRIKEMNLKALSFKGCIINDAKYLQDLLETQPKLIHLSIRNILPNSFQITNIIKIFRNLTTFNNLKKLDFSKIQGLGEEILEFAIQHKANLTHINFSQTHFRDKVKAFEKFFESKFPNAIAFGMFAVDGLNNLVIPSIKENFPNLRHLDMNFGFDTFPNRKYHSIWLLWEIITLKTLIWENNYGKDEMFIPPLKENRNSIANLKNMEILNLKSSRMTDLTIFNGISKLKKLKQLDISFSEVTIEGLRSLGEGHLVNLDSLIIIEAHIPFRLFGQVLKVAAENFPKLKKFVTHTSQIGEDIEEYKIKMDWSNVTYE